LELSAEAIDTGYHKIQAQPDKIEQLLIKRGVKAIPRKSAEIVLDYWDFHSPAERQKITKTQPENVGRAATNATLLIPLLSAGFYPDGNSPGTHLENSGRQNPEMGSSPPSRDARV
jgi:hypothetical protein